MASGSGLRPMPSPTQVRDDRISGERTTMTVVAGVDESPVSKLVAARAVKQARWRGTDLQLVHVAYAPMLYADVPIDWSEVLEAQRKLVWAQL